MSLSIGIVGLPNVGKSTLFKALTKKQVDISNYPFCTIEPNIGVVAVTDERLEKLAELFHSKKVIPAVIKFVDIAGLVKGANKGEGLGNQFLSHIKEVDAVVHIVRCFQEEKIIHVENTVDPIRDIAIINTELLLKDLETAGKRINNLEKDVRANKKEAMEELEILKIIEKLLNNEESVYEYLKKSGGLSKNRLFFIRQLNLLTTKPTIFIFNSDKEPTGELLKQMDEKNNPYLTINLKEEMESAELNEVEKTELGIKSDLSGLIKKAYALLGLITFFTTGSDETRGWTIKNGTKVPQAAGVIHSDFENKFIKAEVIQWDKLIESGGFSEAASKGLLRIEGKDYVVEDGDVLTIRHG